MDSKEKLMTLLTKHLLPDDFIESCSEEVLDSEGLYFSSDVTKVEVLVRNKDGKKRQFSLVMKVMPAQEKQVELNSKLGFQKEAAFYNLAVPEYNMLLERNGVKPLSLPKLYKATDQVILLGNLHAGRYSSCKARLDEEHTRLVLHELAKFHAAGIALKLYNADDFHSKFAEVMVPGLRNAENVRRDEVNRKFRHEIETLVKSMEGCEHFAGSVSKILEKIDEQKLPLPCEPYATLLHNDLWWGNIMFKYSPNNKPKKLKLIDFQNTIFNSPARELVYLIFTSVQPNLVNNFEMLISFYSKTLLEYLSIFQCDTSLFTLEKLIEEVNFYGPTKLKHMILLCKTLSGSSADAESYFKHHLRQILMMFKDREWL